MIEYPAAVRELVEFCYRSGSIDYRFTPSPTSAEGIAGHQQVNASRPATYQAELPLDRVFAGQRINLRLRGRIDGYDAALGYVEEIKTLRVEVTDIPQPVQQLHRAQAMVYAGMLCLENSELQQLEVRVCYYNIDDGRETLLTEQHGREVLLAFVDEAVSRYSQWLEQMHELRCSRDASLQTLPFPYPDYRAGQRDMAELVYKCVDQQGQLLLQAPTGIGKTAAVIFPALKALGRAKHEVVAYVTAKTSGRVAAEQSLDSMQAQGLKLIAVSVTAKERVCFSPGQACHADDCDYAAGYYDRLPQARAAAVVKQELLDRAAIESLARAHRVCPYQLAADLLPWADFCIGDSHYFYSLLGGLNGLLEQGSRRCSVVLDEAHNLPARARDMYGAELQKQEILAVRKAAPKSVARALDRCNRALLALQKEDWQEPDFTSEQEIPEAFLYSLHNLSSAIGEAMAEDPALLQRLPALRDCYFNTLQWLRVAENFGADFRFQMQRDPSQRQSLQVALVCLDASRLLAERQQRLHSVVAFTATANPPRWLLGSLGFSDSAVYQSLPSPFQPEQYRVRINTHIDTRYQQRQRSLPQLATAIAEWLDQVTGNCMVFFPSYAYMDSVLALLDADRRADSWVVQRPQQGDAERQALLDRLQSESGVVAFCILGGVFGEGIDLPGEALRSVVVVGVGLPQYNRQTRILQQYYEASVGSGFEHAFVYPGMQKVSQALGRVIRTATDEGEALLIDSRYRRGEYRDLLPVWWHYDFT